MYYAFYLPDSLSALTSRIGVVDFYSLGLHKKNEDDFILDLKTSEENARSHLVDLIGARIFDFHPGKSPEDFLYEFLGKEVSLKHDIGDWCTLDFTVLWERLDEEGDELGVYFERGNLDKITSECSEFFLDTIEFIEEHLTGPCLGGLCFLKGSHAPFSIEHNVITLFNEFMMIEKLKMVADLHATPNNVLDLISEGLSSSLNADSPFKIRVDIVGQEDLIRIIKNVKPKLKENFVDQDMMFNLLYRELKIEKTKYRHNVTVHIKNPPKSGSEIFDVMAGIWNLFRSKRYSNKFMSWKIIESCNEKWVGDDLLLFFSIYPHILCQN